MPKSTVPIRRKSRELALQVLYQAELGGADPLAAFDTYVGHFDANKKAVDYARRLVAGVAAHLPELDELLRSHAANWRLERMAVVDRNLLRIGAYEITREPDIPHRVAINEALEIARRFSTDDAVSFVNGILDAVSRATRPPGETSDLP